MRSLNVFIDRRFAGVPQGHLVGRAHGRRPARRQGVRRGDKRKFAQGRCRTVGVPVVAARRVLADVAARVPQALAEEVASVEKRNAALELSARVHAGAEARFMRVLGGIIVREMLERLKK